MKNMNHWEEKTVPISEIKLLLEAGYEVEVDSPDGYVPAVNFVDKGLWEEYILVTSKGKLVKCNENHLFETDRGWIYAKELLEKDFLVLGDSGFEPATVVKTGNIIPIVDIQIDHENHRYYTNGISSHNTGVGKSMFLCHHAANCLSQNLNVLYITCEMAEERIAERIDANLMNVSMDNLKQIPKQLYDKKMDSIRENFKGKLIIKEYPTATATVNHFRALLEELRLKKKFVPDVLFVDYLNICASSRFKMGGGVNTYMYVKSIAEELRGLAVEYSLPLWTATQTNREGFGNQDIDMSETSDSFGLPMTADFMFALISTEELEEVKQILVKQLKNRYNDGMANRKFILSLDRSMMKFKDAPNTAQSGILKANQTEEKNYGKGFDMRTADDKFSRKKVEDWKI